MKPSWSRILRSQRFPGFSGGITGARGVADHGAPRHLGSNRRPELHADVHLRAGRRRGQASHLHLVPLLRIDGRRSDQQHPDGQGAGRRAGLHPHPPGQPGTELLGRGDDDVAQARRRRRHAGRRADDQVRAHASTTPTRAAFTSWAARAERCWCKRCWPFTPTSSGRARRARAFRPDAGRTATPAATSGATTARAATPPRRRSSGAISFAPCTRDTRAPPAAQTYQGDADTTISYKNTGEAIKEWTNVLGLSMTPTSTDTGYKAQIATYNRQFWKNSCGQHGLRSLDITGRHALDGVRGSRHAQVLRPQREGRRRSGDGLR